MRYSALRVHAFLRKPRHNTLPARLHPRPDTTAARYACRAALYTPHRGTGRHLEVVRLPVRRRPAAGPRRRRVHFGRGGRAPVSGRPPVGSGRVPAVGGLRPAGVRAGPSAEARADRLRRRAAGWQETARADGPPVPCLARGGESIHPRFHVSVKALARIPPPPPLFASLPLYALPQPAHLLQSPGSGVCRL
jgi:hypothetical protein